MSGLVGVALELLKSDSWIADMKVKDKKLIASGERQAGESAVRHLLSFVIGILFPLALFALLLIPITAQGSVLGGRLGIFQESSGDAVQMNLGVWSLLGVVAAAMLFMWSLKALLEVVHYKNRYSYLTSVRTGMVTCGFTLVVIFIGLSALLFLLGQIGALDN